MGYHLNFAVIWRNWDKMWDGLLLSLQLAAISILIGIVIGLSLAVAYVSGGKATRGAITVFVEAIRNVPLLLLVYLIFYGLPQIVDIRFDNRTSFVATLSIYGGAYLVEVFRAGLEAVPKGQIDAGKAIGLTPWQRFIHVRLPVMTRISLPALSNTFISLFKDTSIASVIAVPELTWAANWINLNTFRIVEAYLSATVLYLVTGYVLLFLLRQLERRYAIAGHA